VATLAARFLDRSDSQIAASGKWRMFSESRGNHQLRVHLDRQIAFRGTAVSFGFGRSKLVRLRWHRTILESLMEARVFHDGNGTIQHGDRWPGSGMTTDDGFTIDGSRSRRIIACSADGSMISVPTRKCGFTCNWLNTCSNGGPGMFFFSNWPFTRRQSDAGVFQTVVCRTEWNNGKIKAGPRD
jgi:hypothetical protein